MRPRRSGGGAAIGIGLAVIVSISGLEGARRGAPKHPVVADDSASLPDSGAVGWAKLSAALRVELPALYWHQLAALRRKARQTSTTLSGSFDRA